MCGEKREREEEKRNGLGVVYIVPSDPEEEGSIGFKAKVAAMYTTGIDPGRSCFFGQKVREY